jgi:hypothetical protein
MPSKYHHSPKTDLIAITTLAFSLLSLISWRSCNKNSYIDSHPESTSVAWAAKGAYVLIYDMDGLRLELNAAGYAQQNSAASLVSYLFKVFCALS